MKPIIMRSEVVIITKAKIRLATRLDQIPTNQTRHSASMKQPPDLVALIIFLLCQLDFNPRECTAAKG